MRCEDRLRPHFHIDPAVARARLPSLLLQPLVENAIKYAVTPQEEGADITLSAQLAGENVRITVSDKIGRASCRESVSVRVDLGGRRIIKKKKIKQKIRHR